jgi:hypothetical protein
MTTENQTAVTTIVKPELQEGETYIGATINADGTGHHTILLPGDNDDATWQAQMGWAKSIGGDLPTRIEQAMLYDKHKDEFQSDWYWSNTQPASDSDYAWLQHFSDGLQHCYHKGYDFRARAVRRLPIE